MAANDPVPPALSSRMVAARTFAAEAGILAMRMRPPPGAAQASLKSRQDWLTEADGAVERLLSDRLADAFPQDGFQGEEGGRARDGRFRWVVDPIDGTSNFARGGTRWCVSLGLLEDATSVLGVLDAPALAETYAAVQGGGATLNDAPIHAAATTDLARAIVECGWSPRVDDDSYIALCRSVLANGAMLRSGGSGAMGLAEVAAGRLDGYIEQHINLWDCCAALAILQEAGAHVSAFLPAGLTAGAPILACAPALAERLSQLAAG